MNKTFTTHTKTLEFKTFEAIVKQQELDSFFTEEEIRAYGQEKRPRSLGVRWLAKKMLLALLEKEKTASIHCRDISILSMPNGKPLLLISTDAILPQIHISLSHTRNLLTVMLVIEETRQQTNDL